MKSAIAVLLPWASTFDVASITVTAASPHCLIVEEQMSIGRLTGGNSSIMRMVGTLSRTNHVIEHLERGSLASAAEASEALFNEHAAFVYRTAYGVTGRHEDAEDVLQSLFLRLLTRPAAARDPKAYLYRAAVNLSLNLVRNRGREIAVDPKDLPDVAAPEAWADDERHRLLYQAVAELKPATAQILVLRHVHEMSDVDIARWLGVSRGSIALRLFRARARLKKLLRERMVMP
jgi:RNA polymerase sigma-70 factor (ECF subfamily)